MQLSRVILPETESLLFARLQTAYGLKQFQRTFEEALSDAYYVVTQEAQPVKLTLTGEALPIDMPLNLEVKGEKYILMYEELKRRLRRKLNRDPLGREVMIEIIKLAYAYHAQPKNSLQIIS